MDKKKEYLDKVEAQLKEWKNMIDRLEARTSMVSSERKSDLMKEIEELRRKKVVVKEKWEDMQKTGGEVLDTLKEGVEKAAAELKQALDKVISRFK
ncbi:MAG: hypothetical protein CXR30_10210 [Geobacter sp.]|nr:MAG: hypothetical protein CXR30_10210 [Geobacter sp.]